MAPTKTTGLSTVGSRHNEEKIPRRLFGIAAGAVRPLVRYPLKQRDVEAVRQEVTRLRLIAADDLDVAHELLRS